MNRKTLKMKILRYKAKRKMKREAHEERATLKAEKKFQRAETEYKRRAALIHRKTEAEAKKTVAEAQLKAKREAQLRALKESRETRKARLLTEKELRAEQIRPYKEAVVKAGKGVYAVGKGVISAAGAGLKKLAEASKEYERQHPQTRSARPARPSGLDLNIDLGLPKGAPPKQTGKIDIGI